MPSARPISISFALVMLLPSAAATQEDGCGAPAVRVAAARWSGYETHAEDVSIRDVRAGYEVPLLPTVSLVGEAGVLLPEGRRGGAEVDATGGTAGVSLVWRPVCGRAGSLSFTHGYGVAYFDRAFPPGGSAWNGTLQFGVGGTLRVADGVALEGGVRHFHVSNGKGLVPQNPAFNGVGVHLGLRATLGSVPLLLPSSFAGDTAAGARGGGVRVEEAGVLTGVQSGSYSTGGGGGEDAWFAGGAARATAPLAAGARLQVDATAGEYLGHGTFVNVAATAFRRFDGGAAGVSWSHARFEGFRTDQALVVGERHEGAALTVAGAAGVEMRDGDDLMVAELFLRLYPAENLMVASGVSWARADTKQTDADLLVRLEAQPRRLLGERASFFVERRNKDLRFAAGIRIHPGAPRGLRTRHRTDGLTGLR